MKERDTYEREREREDSDIANSLPQKKKKKKEKGSNQHVIRNTKPSQTRYIPSKFH